MGSYMMLLIYGAICFVLGAFIAALILNTKEDMENE